MTKALSIKDIARLAGVSTATVSKVLNQKDQDIGEETKQKIIKIVQETNYVPYQKVIQRMAAKTGAIGLVLPGVTDSFSQAFIRGVEECAYREKRSVILGMTDGDPAKEKKHLDTLLQRNAEGVLMVPSAGFTSQDLNPLQQEGVPCLLVGQGEDSETATRILLDHRQAAYLATECLLRMKHEKIGYMGGPLTHQDEAGRLEGYKKALYDHGLAFNRIFVYEAGEQEGKQAGYVGGRHLLSQGVTAIITASDILASGVYLALNEAGVHIPKDVSVIGCGDSSLCSLLTPSLTSVGFPAYEIGFQACSSLIAQIQGETVDRKLVYEPYLTERQSTSPPQLKDSAARERMVIVGSLNMDIIMRVSHIPRVGETILTSDIKNAAGGKGANQAVGAGKLGGRVYMIGRVGNDLYGRELYNSLIKNGVDANGIVFDDLLPTGNAYIYVSENGDNNIVVNPGANSRLSVEQVQSFEMIFDQVSYCLIQMEIPMDTIEYVAALCREKKVKLILNPAPARELNYRYFQDGFLIVPNETEIERMIPGEASIEEKAGRLLAKGFQNVIVTLGEKGCLLVNDRGKEYFPAAKFKAVDTTGAGDSFISGLAVALADGKELADAIRFASLAAGITVSREGAQPSLPDYETIRMYM